MTKISDAVYSGLKLAAVVVIAAVVSGCISAKSQPTEIAAAAVPAPEVPAPAPVPAAPPPPPEPEPVAQRLTSWLVAAGDHLWGIAAVEEVYSVPERWPLLYKSNLDQIEDADLIFPGQVLEIPRDVSQSEIDAAVHHAKNRGAWAVGPIELSDKQYLKNSS